MMMMKLFVVIVLYCVSATPCIIALIVVVIAGCVDREAGVGSLARWKVGK